MFCLHIFILVLCISASAYASLECVMKRKINLRCSLRTVLFGFRAL
jgi:hypothetical protein